VRDPGSIGSLPSHLRYSGAALADTVSANTRLALMMMALILIPPHTAAPRLLLYPHLGMAQISKSLSYASKTAPEGSGSPRRVGSDGLGGPGRRVALVPLGPPSLGSGAEGVPQHLSIRVHGA
jgi:hypothetical protein